MSILIKGMKMPTDTCEIRMTIDMNGRWWATRLDAVDTWHEVVALPDTHGRLVDADAMCADLATVDIQYQQMVEWCVSVTEAQPTIVEAEGESCEK